MRASTGTLETVRIQVPDSALWAYEAALGSVCPTVAFFRGQDDRTWVVEAVRNAEDDETALAAALAVAAAISGVTVAAVRAPLPAKGWLARSRAAFPEQAIGRRFIVRGTHLPPRRRPSRITLRLDAALAFGSGEHGSTRGCLLALERAARRRPRRVLDLGTGSGILAMAAGHLLHRPVLAVDIDPWSVRAAHQNAARNGLRALVRVRRADGWRDPRVRGGGPYDLVLANILARPLCLMACDLAAHLAPGGTAILSGLLASQARQVAVAYRRRGLCLERAIGVGAWTTLVMRGPDATWR
jgi:ribosomal protein L11 methyltransferase